MKCFHCGRQLELQERVGFRDACPGCDRPLHACLNCAFHDPAYNNQCREPQAERVVDKDRFNFCEYFRPRGAETARRPLSPAAGSRAKLEELFRKQ